MKRGTATCNYPAYTGERHLLRIVKHPKDRKMEETKKHRTGHQRFKSEYILRSSIRRKSGHSPSLSSCLFTAATHSRKDLKGHKPFGGQRPPGGNTVQGHFATESSAQSTDGSVQGSERLQGRTRPWRGSSPQLRGCPACLWRSPEPMHERVERFS